jgi:hypothetical protein
MVCNPGGDNPFQYEIGVTYEKPKAELCRHGFHACEAPLDVLGYYPPVDGSRYFEADLEDVSPEREYDSKVCGKKITLGAEIGIPGLIKAHVEYVKSKCKEEQKCGYSSELTGGNRSALTGGDCSALTGGEWSSLTGGNSSALTGGSRSALTGGDCSALRGGAGSKFRGGMWSVFAAEIRDEAYNLIGVKAAVVDGKTIKPDTWYALKDGEFVEVDE